MQPGRIDFSDPEQRNEAFVPSEKVVRAFEKIDNSAGWRRSR